MQDAKKDSPSIALLRAAQYLRMSTEHQQYSIANQSAAIALYAAAHNIGIVRSFKDEGKSGTTIKGRSGLQELLRVVQSGSADFDLILVYDVSRWGRFPDADEAAHYEYLCKKAGIEIRYCGEQFENDSSTTSNLLKALKRTMAGEFSRELGAKVFAGKCRLASTGLWVSGSAPFGMMRQLVDSHRKPKQTLMPGERKSIQTDHVMLKLGPKDEVEMVRLVFDLFTKKGMSQRAILRYLNQRGLLRRGRPWGRRALLRMLRNPVYKGTSAFRRYTLNKYGKRTLAPAGNWAVRDAAFPAIISPDQFARAQELISMNASTRHDDSKMLASLTRLWKCKGGLKSALINQTKGIPRACVFNEHFGSLSKAYDLIGYPHRDCTYARMRPIVRAKRDKLCEEICYWVCAVGGTAKCTREPGLLLINGTVTAEVKIASGPVNPQGRPSWRLPITMHPEADLLILARIQHQDHSILDYYVIPRLAQIRGKFVITAPQNVAFLDIHRVETLSGLLGLLGCSRIPGA